MVKRFFHVVLAAFLFVTIIPGPAWTDNGPEHQVEQLRPIQLGTSGGNIGDLSYVYWYCCSGTLGALVQDGDGGKYILSNNHVLARTNSALTGEYITQPGLIDQATACDEDMDDTVALFTAYVPIDFDGASNNEVDAAIAMVVPGAVDADGAILDIGEVNSQTLSVQEAIGKKVKKSGRTTGLTTGTVAAINVTVNVGYSTECGGPATQVTRFDDQILISGPRFSSGGDSGSLIVEAVDSYPKAVGLLFAGSKTSTLANPINAVLDKLGVTMVGGTPPPPPPTGTGRISGRVSKTDGAPIEKAIVRADTGEWDETDVYGNYAIFDVPAGDRRVTASAEGYRSKMQTVTVQGGLEMTTDFVLKPGKVPSAKRLPKAAMDHARNVKARHGARLFEIPAVVGHGVGLSKTGQPVIEVYLEKESTEARARIPQALDHVPVRVVVTGSFEAF